MSDLSSEVPEADVAEQAAPVHEEDFVSDEDEGWPEHLPDDAAEGDAAEQVRVVELDEDDYR
jgi:hypothetical protein